MPFLRLEKSGLFYGATKCGFTPQYDEFWDLYELHQRDGLEILDFLCISSGSRFRAACEAEEQAL